MIYYGFFDADFDETTGKYDRTYNSGDFTGYFENFIGSGVCVYNNPDSFKVSVSGTDAIIASGYLFINGYWLKNDSDYTISFAGIGDGVYAVYAKLNLGARFIELGQMAKTDSYADILVLAYITITDGVLSLEDTRYNADICGVIDAVGSLSSKIDYAINYIDTEIESKLQQIEQDLQNQSDIINSKLDEANALIAKIAPPPIGTVKFSASSTIEDGWLKCDGSFVSETDYPELVAALGKLIPSGDKFKLISDSEIGTSVTNAVLHNGRIWVYSWSTQKLYGVDIEGEQPIKEITITCDDTYFSSLQNPNTGSPLALSIVSDFSGSYKIFLGQITKTWSVSSPAEPDIDESALLLYSGNMSSDGSSITLTRPFAKIDLSAISSESDTVIDTNAILYVVSKQVMGEAKFYTCIAAPRNITRNGEDWYSIQWGKSEVENASLIKHEIYAATSKGLEISVCQGEYGAYSHKNNDEILVITDYEGGSAGPELLTTYGKVGLFSYPDAIFDRERSSSAIDYESQAFHLSETLTTYPIAGNTKVLVRTNLTNSLIYYVNRTELTPLQKSSITDVSLPSSARTFKDGSCYLWGKDMFFIFVGTGILFSRTLQEGSFGYLDTTSILGQITQGGYIDYSQDEGTLYIMGQDTTNKIKVAKIVLNTLYDYANDGAWLPLIASDGVPAWIKAKEVE